MAICSPTGEWASGAAEGRLNVFPCPSEGSEFPLATEEVGSRRFSEEALREESRGAFFVYGLNELYGLYGFDGLKDNK